MSYQYSLFDNDVRKCAKAVGHPHPLCNDFQGLRGKHRATGYPLDIPLNGKQLQLARDRGPHMNDLWDMMCDSIVANGYIDPRGNMDIDFIVLKGNDLHVFH